LPYAPEVQLYSAVGVYPEALKLITCGYCGLLEGNDRQKREKRPFLFLSACRVWCSTRGRDLLPDIIQGSTVAGGGRRWPELRVRVRQKQEFLQLLLVVQKQLSQQLLMVVPSKSLLPVLLAKPKLRKTRSTKSGRG
jgi:hypothetical protein